MTLKNKHRTFVYFGNATDWKRIVQCVESERPVSLNIPVNISEGDIIFIIIYAAFDSLRAKAVVRGLPTSSWQWNREYNTSLEVQILIRRINLSELQQEFPTFPYFFKISGIIEIRPEDGEEVISYLEANTH